MSWHENNDQNPSVRVCNSGGMRQSQIFNQVGERPQQIDPEDRENPLINHIWDTSKVKNTSHSKNTWMAKGCKDAVGARELASNARKHAGFGRFTIHPNCPRQLKSKPSTQYVVYATPEVFRLTYCVWWNLRRLTFGSAGYETGHDVSFFESCRLPLRCLNYLSNQL
jgi:hypothetical protein